MTSTRKSIMGFVPALFVLCALIAGVVIAPPVASASEGCTNEARRQEQDSTFLPDCRAYELVTLPYQPSPVVPVGSDVGTGNVRSFPLEGGFAPFELPEPENGQVALNGNSDMYLSPEPNSESSAEASNLSRRGPDGWIGEDIVPPLSRTGFLCGFSGYSGYSPNLEQILVQLGESEDPFDVAEDCGHAEPSLTPGESRESGNLFLRNTASGSFELVNVTPPGAKSYDPRFNAISADGSHVVFDSRAQLTADAPNGEKIDKGTIGERCASAYGNVYVWNAGAVRLLTVLPAGIPARGTLAGSNELDCGIVSKTSGFTQPVSTDGERILFYAGGGFRHEPGEDNEHPGEIYAEGNRVAGNAPYIEGGLYLREHPSAEQSLLLHGGGAGSGTVVEHSTAVTGLSVTDGEFTVGQDVAGRGIPGGTTVVACAPDCAGATELTLSAQASASASGVALEASSECTEPEKGCTVQIDAPEGGSGAPGGGQFQWASTDGSRVFFTDEEKLTSASTAQTGKPDLYEYDLEKPAGGRLTDLTVDTTEPAYVLGFSGASEDGSYVYFVAQGVLSGAQQNSHGAAAMGPAQGTGTLTEGSKEVTGLSTASGAFAVGMAIGGPGIPADTWIESVGGGILTISKPSTESGARALSATAANLYLRHDGATTFVAPLNGVGGDRCDWTAYCLTAQVTASGAFIAFNSLDSLTGYDNRPLHPEACAKLTVEPGSPCMETFRYAADSGAHGELTCATCNPAGTSPESVEGAWSTIPMVQKEIGTSELDFNEPLDHDLSNSGQIFFQTKEKLVSSDENETFDVYEYGGGEGSSAQIHLISTGKSKYPSFIEDATPDGANVFFYTIQPLLRADTRQDYDIYDARVGGGFASQSEAVEQPACEAVEACRSPLAEPPGELPAASATLAGGGNLAATVPARPVVKKLVKKKALTRKQLLENGLKACVKRYRHKSKRRDVCERQVRRRYGAIPRMSRGKRRAGK